MSKHPRVSSFHTAAGEQPAEEARVDSDGLPNRLLTALQVAQFVGCHEESVRRAYLQGLLIAQRFGVRGRRFHPKDVIDWLRRGAPTRVSSREENKYGSAEDL